MTALAADFATEEHHQSVFRRIMMALARPILPRPFPVTLDPPRPLTPEMAAVALALADHETPIWLDETLDDDPPVTDYLRFQTGARIVSDPAQATFSLVADPLALPAFEAFALGTQDYPDRSATLVLAVPTLSTGTDLLFEGPGIRGSAGLTATALPADFAACWRRNRTLFPRGLDVILVASGMIVGLPRSAALRDAR